MSEPIPPLVKQVVEHGKPWPKLTPEQCAELQAWLESVSPIVRKYAQALAPGTSALAMSFATAHLACIPHGLELAETIRGIEECLAYQRALAKWSPPDAPRDTSKTAVLTTIQKQILQALDGRALKKESLAEQLKIDPSRFYRPGALKELIEQGLVAHKPMVGYYRPDRPPEALVIERPPQP